MNKEESKKQYSIQNFFKRNILKQVFTRNSTKFTPKKKFKKVTFSDESSISSDSSNVNLSDEDYEESSSSDYESDVENFIDEKSIDLYNNNSKKEEELYYYKVNFKNIFLFIYNFEKHNSIEIKNFQNKSQVEIIIEEEKKIIKNNSSKFLNKPKSKNNINIIKKNNKIDDKQLKEKEKEEIKIEKIELQKQNYLNIYSITWLLIIFFNFIILIILTTLFFSYCFEIKTKITQTIKIHNLMSDLMEDSNRAIYFSIQIIILQNKLYKKYYPSRKELLKFSRDNLKNIYNNCIKIIHEITTYTVSASSTTKSNIDNYSLNLTTISSDLERNITITKYLNVIEEFSFAIYSFMNLKDENVSFLDTSFNFILGNYETLLIDDLEDFSNIFLDEFILLKKQLIIIIIIIVVIYLIVFFISLFLQFKIMRKIFDEQERTTDIFFKINPDYIKKIKLILIILFQILL